MKLTFEGSKEKWESLSPEEQSKYDCVILRPEMPIIETNASFALDSDVENLPPIGGFHDW